MVYDCMQWVEIADRDGYVLTNTHSYYRNPKSKIGFSSAAENLLTFSKTFFALLGRGVKNFLSLSPQKAISERCMHAYT